MSSTSDLLGAWREATRAAELAEQLATLAMDAADQADRNAVVSEEIAELAESAAEAAERAAHTARTVARQARAHASDTRGQRLVNADHTASDARGAESAARDQYHDAEREARRRHDEEDGDSGLRSPAPGANA